MPRSAMVEGDGGNMSNSSGLDDEETPLPVLSEKQEPVARVRASVTGDFRTHETVLSTLAVEDVYEVRLSSDVGETAHFAVDAPLAPQLAVALKRQLSASRDQEVFRECPSSPRRAQLDDPGTHIFFAAVYNPDLSVERDGDRIVLMLFDALTSLHVSFQAGIAIDLCQFFAAASANL